LEEEKKPQTQEVKTGEKEEKKVELGQGQENFSTLFEESVQHRHIDEGEIVKGVVVSVEKDYVMVDIGDKCEGQVPVEELKEGSGEISVKPGEEIEVLVEERQEEQGIIFLSKAKAEKKRLWEVLDQAYHQQQAVKGKIIERVKGGYKVDLGGVIAFMPGSQADLRPVREPDKLVGKEDYFQVVKFNRRRLNVVVSRRAVLEKKLKDLREQTLTGIEEGMIIKGKVKNLTEYGAFIDIGGLDGLLHITDMSWRRINHPSEILSVGDELEVKVAKFDRARARVSLSLKDLEPDPWMNVDKRYPVGTIVKGKVTNVTDYGAFVELEPGVEGLVHVSEMSWSKKRISASDIVKMGQMVEARVLSIDLVNRKINLGIKQVLPNPWEIIAQKYPVGAKVRGKIKNITNFGIFIGLDEEIDGLVHISDISWVKKFRHPKELFKKGDEVECLVREVDPERKRFGLSIKDLQTDPWSQVPEKYRPGKRVMAKVVSITDFGVFAELEEGIEGLIHISELSDKQIKDPKELVQSGQELKVEILSVDAEERRIRLSLKAAEQPEPEQKAEQYQPPEWDGTSKLGEIIQKKLAEAKGKELFANDALEKKSSVETNSRRDEPKPENKK